MPNSVRQPKSLLAAAAEATQLLAKRHQLAIHQNKERALAERLKRLREANSQKRAWLNRVDKSGLP